MQIHKKIFLCLTFTFISVISISAVSASEYPMSEYLRYNTHRTVHAVHITSPLCVMWLSTKVGKWDAETKNCIYEKETAAYSGDECGFRYLNGGILERKVGKNYTCAATHARSNMGEGLDEFKLILNAADQYVGSEPSTGEIVLK